MRIGTWIFIGLAAATAGAQLWSGAAGAQGRFANPQTIEVDLSNYEFTPETLSLQQGRPYRIHFVNRAGGGHDFTAKSFFAHAAIAPGDQAKVEDGEVELKGGTSKNVTLIPEQAGTYKVHCSHFMHALFGMTGRIVVT